MKKTISVFLTIFLGALFAADASAKGRGGDDSGGGFRFSSTVEEVKAAVEDLRSNTRVIDELALNQAYNPDYTSDPTLKRALGRFYSTKKDNAFGYLLFSEFNVVKLELKDSCLEVNGLEADASTKFGRNAPICFNQKTLTNLGPSELRLQVVSLAMHEITHHYQPKPRTTEERDGLEAEAMAVQRYTYALLKEHFSFVDFHNSENGQSYSPQMFIYAGGKEEIDIVDGDGSSQSEVRSSVKVTVTCSKDQWNVSKLYEKLPPNLAGGIVLAPGSAVALNQTFINSRPNYGAVICYNLSPVNCQVRQKPADPVQYQLIMGDNVAFTGALENVNGFLADYRTRGICK